jgi:hypothetical protein
MERVEMVFLGGYWRRHITRNESMVLIASVFLDGIADVLTSFSPSSQAGNTCCYIAAPWFSMGKDALLGQS